MSSSVFPSLAGLDVKVERSTLYKTTVHETTSGKEDRTSWMPSPRYRYALSFNVLRESENAPSPWQAQTEVGVVLKFFNDHFGQGDSFMYADPYSGTSTQVRFVEDSLKITAVTPDIWECKFELISVL